MATWPPLKKLTETQAWQGRSLRLPNPRCCCGESCWLGPGWLGVPAPFSAGPERFAQKRLSYRSAAIFFPPPKYLSPPVGADLFSLDSSILSLSSFILNLPSILSSCSRESPSQPLPCLL